MEELVHGYPEAFTEAFQGGNAQEGLRKDTEDKEKAVTAVRDDGVRQDGMGMATTATDQAEDGYFRKDGDAMDKVDDSASIIRMDMAVPGGATGGAGLELRPERGHIGIEKGF